MAAVWDTLSEAPKQLGKSKSPREKKGSERMRALAGKRWFSRSHKN
jgi:hypothetical protein